MAKRPDEPESPTTARNAGTVSPNRTTGAAEGGAEAEGESWSKGMPGTQCGEGGFVAAMEAIVADRVRAGHGHGGIAGAAHQDAAGADEQVSGVEEIGAPDARAIQDQARHASLP